MGKSWDWQKKERKLAKELAASMKQVQEGKFDTALVEVNKVLAKNPRNYLALNQKGILLGHLGRHHETLSVFNQLLKIKQTMLMPTTAKD